MFLEVRPDKSLWGDPGWKIYYSDEHSDADRLGVGGAELLFQLSRYARSSVEVCGGQLFLPHLAFHDSDICQSSQLFLSCAAQKETEDLWLLQADVVIVNTEHDSSQVCGVCVTFVATVKDFCGQE